MKWIKTDNYIHGKYGKNKFTYKTKVAGFDLDHTIIKPINGKRFSNTATDWKFFDKTVISKLRKYHEDKYNIVIYTNQRGIAIGKTDVDLWKQKIDNIANKLEIPFIILVSLNNDMYRKPRTKLWDKFIKCNKDKSFYCGDAGGRPKRIINGQYILRDYSDTDHKFAYNVGIKFIHRDMFIYNHKMNKSITYAFDLNKIKTGKYQKFVPAKKTEMIIIVGYQGSGKTYYTKNYILSHKYKYINRDTIGTKRKCLKLCEESLKNNTSVVIDNTNPSVKARKEYLDIAKKYNIRVRCIHFDTPIEVSMHNNIYRHVTSNFPVSKIIPKVAYSVYKKYFENPSKDEGFCEIVVQDFILNTDNIDENIYYSYLM